MKEYLDLLDFIPARIISGKKNKLKNLSVDSDQNSIGLSYKINGSNNSKREYSLVIPRFIQKSEKTFEVLGLLQAEMGKTQNGSIVFPNSEPKIINKVLKWFEKELGINRDTWRWYIAINIKEPCVEERNKIEARIVNYWVKKTEIRLNRSHPKRITYRRVEHIKLKNNYFGCLMIEYKNNLFSQIIKRFLKKITYNRIEYENKKDIRAFMRGIIAGEGTIAYHKKSRHYGVHISATERKEREIYKKCLNKLEINIKIYENYKEMLISKRENNVKLLNQRLMTLHPKKYNKFLNMMKQYPKIEKETDYFKHKGENVWNKIPEEKVDNIIELYKSGITRTIEIAEKVGVSKIKVNRVLKENNLGKRKVENYPESLKKQIVEFAKRNPKISQREIAEKFDVSTSAVIRIFKKYKIEKSEKDRLNTPLEKINQVLKLYKENPNIKFKEVLEKVKISDTALVNIRRIYGIDRLGYYYTVGNNPGGKNQYSKAFKSKINNKQ